MGTSVNILTVTGNLGRDPEMSYTPNGKAVTKLSVPVTFYDNSKRESASKGYETFWANVVIWGERGEYINKYARKGTLVCVSGEFAPRKYTTKAGKEGVAYEINATQVTLLSKAPTPGTNESLGDLDDHPF